jgi:hypothetical protein
MNGRAHETYFNMAVRYPANPALEHYTRSIGTPWARCEFIPRWQRYLDGTVTPNRTVHEQAYAWVNRDSRRMLMVSSRYYSSKDCVADPENDDQHVVVIEYLGQNIDQAVSTLKLRCP